MPRPPRTQHAARKARTMLFALALGCCSSAWAQIYAGRIDAEASIVLSNFKSADAPELLIEGAAPLAAAPAAASAPAKRPATVNVKMPVASAEMRKLVDEVATQMSIAPELLHAVIAAESGYDSRALSRRGAVGLMQLLPATARRFGVKDLYSPKDNVMGGASYLKWLMALFNNDLELVLAAYNAGEQAVLNAGLRIPPYAETQAYVPKVLAYLRCPQSKSKACKAG